MEALRTQVYPAQMGMPPAMPGGMSRPGTSDPSAVANSYMAAYRAVRPACFPRLLAGGARSEITQCASTRHAHYPGAYSRLMRFTLLPRHSRLPTMCLLKQELAKFEQ